jgi:pyruvate/2-oxoglutarate dehydrogenase complex dihydrolipoamide dehydrogenase (E3) component
MYSIGHLRSTKKCPLAPQYEVGQGLAGGNHVTTNRLIPYTLFTDPELARIGLNEKEAKARGIPYRLFKIPMQQVLRARTVSETRGFLKALVEVNGDRILGFTAFAVDGARLWLRYRLP